MNSMNNLTDALQCGSGYQVVNASLELKIICTKSVFADPFELWDSNDVHVCDSTSAQGEERLKNTAAVLPNNTCFRKKQGPGQTVLPGRQNNAVLPRREAVR